MIVLFIFGTIIGSFTSACIYRTCSSQSIFQPPRSFCPCCNHTLTWLDLIPLVSWLCLKGKCRYCHHPISIHYPLIECFIGVLYILIYLEFGPTLSTVAYMMLSPVLIWALYIDNELMILPDRTHVLCLLCGLVLVYWSPSQCSSKLIGSVIVSIPCLLLARYTGGMGYGDVKLIAVFGFLLGWQLLLVMFILSCFSASVYGLCKVPHNSVFPFGPHLILSFFFSLLYGSHLISWYLTFF